MEPDGRRRIEDPWAVGFAISRAADAVLPELKVMNIHLHVVRIGIEKERERETAYW